MCTRGTGVAIVAGAAGDGVARRAGLRTRGVDLGEVMTVTALRLRGMYSQRGLERCVARRCLTRGGCHEGVRSLASPDMRTGGVEGGAREEGLCCYFEVEGERRSWRWLRRITPKGAHRLRTTRGSAGGRLEVGTAAGSHRGLVWGARTPEVVARADCRWAFASSVREQRSVRFCSVQGRRDTTPRDVASPRPSPSRPRAPSATPSLPRPGAQRVRAKTCSSASHDLREAQRLDLANVSTTTSCRRWWRRSVQVESLRRRSGGERWT